MFRMLWQCYFWTVPQGTAVPLFFFFFSTITVIPSCCPLPIIGRVFHFSVPVSSFYALRLDACFRVSALLHLVCFPRDLFCLSHWYTLGCGRGRRRGRGRLSEVSTMPFQILPILLLPVFAFDLDHAVRLCSTRWMSPNRQQDCRLTKRAMLF